MYWYIKSSWGHQIKQSPRDKYPLIGYKGKSEIGFIFSIFHDYLLLSMGCRLLWWWSAAHVEDNYKECCTVAWRCHITYFPDVCEEWLVEKVGMSTVEAWFWLHHHPEMQSYVRLTFSRSSSELFFLLQSPFSSSHSSHPEVAWTKQEA